MIALDTNAYVRLLINDAPQQSRRVLALIERHGPPLLLATVFLETLWVLESVYGAQGESLRQAAEELVSRSVPEHEGLMEVPALLRAGMDVADALHWVAASHTQCSALGTFDRTFYKRAKKLGSTEAPDTGRASTTPVELL